jgi:arylsulfatase A
MGRGPNFVVFLCDDLGYGDLECYGHTAIKTPNLNALADEGVRLTDCYAAAPVCSPARAGLMTGRTPNRCGIYDWIPPGSPMHLRASETTVAGLLGDAGYGTAVVGKWHLNGKFNSPEQAQPNDHGFDHWFATQNNAHPSHRNPDNFVRNGEEVGPLEGYSSTVIVDEGIDWLKSRTDDAPFFLFVSFHSPHEPVATSEEFTRMYEDTAATPEEAIYFGNVTQTDHEVGRMLATLDELGLRDDTFVMFTSDNGPETLNRYRGAARSYGSPGILRGMKLHVYEGGIRVPGIVRWPGVTRPGSVVQHAVSGVDLLPTACEAAGIAVPDDGSLGGADVAPVLRGDAISRDKPLYWQYDRAISPPRIAIRDGDWKLLANADLDVFELYNLRDDVTERAEASEREPARAAAMQDALRAMHTEVLAQGPAWPDGQ